MKPNLVTSAVVLAMSSAWVPILSSAGWGFPLPWIFPMANQQAEAICIDAAESQGLRVTDVLDRNNFAGGSEIVLQVRDYRSGNRNGYRIGCDYADNTGQVQLYRLDNVADRRDRNDDWFDPHERRTDRGDHWRNDNWNDRWDQDQDNWDDDWNGDRNDSWNDNWNDNRYDWDDWDYDGGRVSNRRDAEGIARRAIESELGVDAGSNVIQVDQARRDDQRWYVEGDVNGAAFVVRIRSEDGAVERFILR